MARIPDYDVAGTSVAQINTPRFQDRSRQIAGEGTQALLGAVGGAIQQAEQHDDKLSYAAARASILKADADSRDTLRNDADPYTYETRYRENLRKAKEGAAKMIRGRQSRALFEADIDADIERGAGQIKEIARGRIADNGRATLQSTIESSLQTALDAKDEGSSIASIETANTSIQAAQDNGYIDAVAGERLRSGFRNDYAEGKVSIQPLDKRISMLANPKGTVAEAIRADRRDQLLDRAREEKRVLEAREQAQQDRREAKAERALGQLEQQIASGVPITDELSKRWSQAVKGTDLEVEFKQVQQREAEVQAMLRKPVGEQVGYIQEREAKLLKDGGSVKDIANLNRLKGAVQRNVQVLQQAPLLYLASRTGEEFAPLDFNALSQGDPEQGALLDDRLAALRAARERVGSEVPLKPLLPQEAQQLSGALQSGTAKDNAELFATLYTNFRDPKAYQGAMQQIAGDSPVKALAGMLAGKQAELVTDTHWFGPDEKVGSQTVARTLLEGEAILNPSAADKKEDGAPKIGLYLPEQSMLQQSFTDAVGDAFRGRPGAADLAYQAVKSYYVGRAAQTGRVASGKEDVDAKLVKEAVNNVLGSVTDYNGAGKVLAPWGMDESTFEDRAEEAFRIEAGRRGIPEDRIEQLSGEISLQNASGNKYRISIGNSPLQDSLGRPIEIEVDDYVSKDIPRGILDRANDKALELLR